MQGPVHTARRATAGSALAMLRGCEVALKAARADAETAAVLLEGARATRATQLAEAIADQIAFCQRLSFVVTAELHYRHLWG